MFAISWKMALVVLSLAPICVLVVRIQRFYARLLGRERSERLAKAAGSTPDPLHPTPHTLHSTLLDLSSSSLLLSSLELFDTQVYEP